MDTPEIDDEWYFELAQKYGNKLAFEAGYFRETRPWRDTYAKIFGAEFLAAPREIKKIMQFSGAFFPFHEGHRDTIQKAIKYLNAPLLVIIHVDHREYRHSKGTFEEDSFIQSFDLTQTLHSNHLLETRLFFEDRMPNGCSRNFTRLYQELLRENPDCEVWFLAGGDRASFCLTFKEKGNCLIVGRDSSSSYIHFSDKQNARVIFLPGNNPLSSTFIRNRND